MWDNRRKRGVHSGFTLVELLVVVAIIGVLIAIVLPALATARWHARLLNCSSNLRNMAQAVNLYASKNKGQFPSFTMPSTGGNAWDLSPAFCRALIRQGITKEDFFCPAADDNSVAISMFDKYAELTQLGYNVWIPRWIFWSYCPPVYNGPPVDYKLPSPKPPEQPGGPTNTQDRVLSINPIITDLVATGGNPSANEDLTQFSASFPPLQTSNHWRKGLIYSINAAYADGRVESIPVSSVRPRYASSQNLWMWR